LACLISILVLGAADAARPLIVSQSGSMEVREGRAFAARVVAVGEALAYQWFRNNQPITGQTGDTLLLSKVTQQDAGNYHVVVSNAGGATGSGQVALAVTPAPALGVAPGEQRLVSVPGHLAYYDLYLPTAYASSRNIPPVLFTFNPSGGGMVGHFRTVAEEKGWIVVGIAQSKNLQGSQNKMQFSRPVVQHALDHLRIDPNRIFVAGMSGGGWSSFDTAKINAPLMAGVFSMGGWLGQQYSMQRDLYLPGLLVARANGDSDTGANSWMTYDRSYLLNWITSDKIRDWSFPGGHVPSPESVQREVFDWLIAGTTASTTVQRDRAREQEALWKARIMAGEARTVFEEMVDIAFNQPRTPLALEAWRTIDFLFSEIRCFLRETPPDFAEFPRRNYVAVNLYHALFAFMQDRDPSRLFSGVAAARALGGAFEAVQRDPAVEFGNILRHPPHTLFDAFVLENALHDRIELPLTGNWDGDDHDNFSEFVLGSSPLVPDQLRAPGIRTVGHEAFSILAGCRSDRTLRLTTMASSDPAEGWWPGSLASGAWWHQAADGTSSVTKSLGNTLTQPKLFVRFGAALDQSNWHDANGDGIPFEYQFPEYQLFGGSVAGDLPDLPDARQVIDMAGGPPMYRRYLTAAEIGPVEGRSGSLRYHPALAGYRGYLLHEVWMNVPGSTVASAASVVASRPPNEVRLITASEAPWFSLEGATIMGDQYFERSRGYIVPDVTGNHVFSIAGDDQCELWLSTGSNPANAVRIAYLNTWTGYRNYTQNASQTSAAIPLVAGNSYYVEILHKEGNGGDHCNVAWMPPGTSTRVTIPSVNLGCLPLALIGNTEP
jgi:hypothetical protein